MSRIGKERIDILTSLAVEAVRNGRDDHAIRYVGLARKIGMKTRTRIPTDFEYCKGCFIPMIPGVNCTVRLTGHKVVSRCVRCDTVRRMPYLREKKP